MHISNIRFGHATNSSSYHSLVFLPDNQNPKDNYNMDGTFGWEFFTCFSQKAKEEYLATILQTNLHRFDPQVVNYIVSSLMPTTLYNPDGYIDHQSRIILPNKFGSDYIDEEFFFDLRNYILQPNLAILGGNDNDEKSHPLANGNFRLPLTDVYGEYTCRKDRINNEWVVFNKLIGTKIRFSFSKKTDFTTTTTKADAPELVDVKITDYCPFNCEFCYQDSRPTGKDETKLGIYTLATIFSDLKVFEVALGGGEPTLSKNFAQIVETFYRKGVTPNFSTKNLDFFHDYRNYKILEMVGGVAVSIIPYDYHTVIPKLSAMLEYHNYPKHNISFQTIVGTGGFTHSSHIGYLMEHMNKFGFNKLTLLGSKPVGRAKGLPEQKIDKNFFSGIKTLSKKLWVNVGVDTKFIEMFNAEVKEEIPSVLYHEEEGKFSCYIDAVEGKIGASSYCEPLIDLPDRITSEVILQHFKTF